jgi:hypothetical protein
MPAHQEVLYLSMEDYAQDRANVFNLRPEWDRVTEAFTLFFSSHGRGGSTPPAAQRGVSRHQATILGHLLLLILGTHYNELIALPVHEPGYPMKIRM